MKRFQLMMPALGLFLFSQLAQAGWTPTQRLTWSMGNSGVPAAGHDSFGNLYVFWQNDSGGNAEIYYKKSTDSGTTWLKSQRLTWTSGNSTQPALAISSAGDLHVLWEDDSPGNYEIYYKKSTNGGASWTASQRLTWNSGSSLAPAIDVDNSGNPYVVWFDSTPGNEEIYFKKSPDKGTTWSTNQRLTWNAGDSSHPAIDVNSSGHINIVWHDDTSGNYEIYYKKSTNGGAGWAMSGRLTWTVGGSLVPDIAADTFGLTHVVWYEDTSTFPEIYYTKSTDGGASWLKSQRLTWTSGNSRDPAIAADPFGYIHLVWTDLTPGNWEIYYKKGTGGGAAWTAIQRLSWTPGDSYQPDIAVDGSGNLYLVWHDYTPGNSEIYFKRGT